MRIHLSLATLSVLGFSEQKYMTSLGVWLYCKDKVCDIISRHFYCYELFPKHSLKSEASASTRPMSSSLDCFYICHLNKLNSNPGTYMVE